MISLLFGVWLSAASAASLGPWWHNKLGIARLAKDDKLGAYREFNRAIELDPLNAKLQFNLGWTFEANEEYEKAEATYRATLELLSKDPEYTKFALSQLKDVTHLDQNLEWIGRYGLDSATEFNLGNVLAAQKNIPGALEAYQAALDHLGPQIGSERDDLRVNDRDVKKNIELLFAKGGGQGDGKGQSDQNDPNQNKDQKNQDKDKKDDKTNQQKREESLKQPQPDQNKDKGKDKKAKPFESQELSPDDVKRILDEIKNQEQNIRAQEYDKKPKDGARGGKDW